MRNFVLLVDDVLDEAHLTEFEKRLFNSALKRGLLDREIHGWTPWWFQVSIHVLFDDQFVYLEFLIG